MAAGSRPLSEDELLLADPRFAGLHRLLKWLMVLCMFALILECTFFLPYFLIRWGWSR